MATFSVVILTAPPPGLSQDAGGGGGGAMVRVDGKECVLRAAELFLNREEVKQVLVVFSPAEVDSARQRFGSHFAFTGIKIAGGGPKWVDQMVAAGEKVAPDSTHVLVHDGARCCVPYNDIDALLEESAKAPAAVALVAPIRSGLFELDDANEPVASPPSQRFVQLLTPIGYNRASFDKIVKTKQDVHSSAFRLVRGSQLNVRVGHSGDEKLVKTLMNILPKPIKRVDGPFGEAQW